jgi:hypothetical protein
LIVLAQERGFMTSAVKAALKPSDAGEQPGDSVSLPITSDSSGLGLKTSATSNYLLARIDRRE